jgi:ABC-type transporter Mla subunit MlaD
MQEPFDWEQAMETTRRSAAAASQNSENAVAGMSKLLREIDRHSNEIARLTKAIDQAAATRAQQVARSKANLDHAQGDSHHSWRQPALGLLAIFAVGVGFGGFIVS